ncbi:MAG: hypothetical protein JWM11_2355, partial [Planctomycetaceae bacterium]|nr:hypothetical protein [Planctomycetaceae bacterium]
SLPAPHLAQSLFRQSPVEAPLQSAPAVAAVPPKMTIPPVANPEAGMPQPVRSISEQERNLRAEFHQALLDRDRRTPASSNNTISPVETAEIGAPPAPHFVPRPKILANVPRVNLTAQAGDSSISATDDSSVLGRALTHRKSNK